jgi:hypothetical protein
MVFTGEKMIHRNRVFGLGMLAVLLAAPAPAQLELTTHQTRYYVLHTNVEPDRVREISRRLTFMAEEYHQRTRGFAGTVRERLPVYVVRTPQGFTALTGMPSTAGMFTGDRLIVLAGEQISPRTWHIVQHEGFHQFAHAAIGRGLPIWANEGLAEYFGEGIYTGDDFYTGFIPPERLARIRKGIQEGELRSLRRMMRLAHETWNAEIGLKNRQAGHNYDQAWSMIHFLAHAKNGRYQNAFGRFLKAISDGQAWEQAWLRCFGNNVDAFQQRWEEYWLSLPNNPTAELYAETTVATLTSFFARAFSQRQHFDTFEEFVAAAEASELKAHKEDWLPPALLAGALTKLPEAGTWSLQRRPGKRLLVCEREDGTILEGRFKIRNRRVKSVSVNVKSPKRKRK